MTGIINIGPYGQATLVKRTVFTKLVCSIFVVIYYVKYYFPNYSTNKLNSALHYYHIQISTSIYIIISILLLPTAKLTLLVILCGSVLCWLHTALWELWRGRLMLSWAL